MGFVEAVGVAIVGGGIGALTTLWLQVRLARTRRRDETWETSRARASRSLCSFHPFTCRFWKHQLRFLQNKLEFFDRKL